MSDIDRDQRLPGLDMSVIQRQLKQRDSMLWSEVGLKVAAGLPLALAGPLLFAVVLTLMGWANDWAYSYFIIWLLLGFALFGALAWKLMRRSESGDVFADDMMRLVSLQPEDATLDSKLEDMVGQEPHVALQILLGPLSRGAERLYEAWQLMQARKQFGPAAEKRAAEAIRDLSTYPAGIPWLDLRNTDESVHELLHILGYLKASEWIGLSKDGQKIWLLSDARKHCR